MVTKSDYAVIGDLHPILEAVVAEVKKRKGV
jgi:electron transfer flavoprotein alpha subunit